MTSPIYTFNGIRHTIERTSCRCGGSWAWLKERESGAMEMVGCVCHNSPTYTREIMYYEMFRMYLDAIREEGAHLDDPVGLTFAGFRALESILNGIESKHR